MKETVQSSVPCVKQHKKSKWVRIQQDKYKYLMLIPAIMVTILFSYVPMAGLVMAFQNFSIFKGYWGSEWVGLKHFMYIFQKKDFLQAIWNTLSISVLKLVICFPAPIILALLLNELKVGRFKKTVQTISYLPHFLSWIAICGFIHMFFGRDGFINDLREVLGHDRITFLAQQENFIWFVIGALLWKETGWGTIIHLSTLSSISPDLYEAATIDGATRMQKIRYITLPHMVPTISILLIFQMGSLFTSSFDLIYGLQNPYIDFEVISTLIYKYGINGGKYSLSTAFGLLEGVVALVLVLVSNKISKKISGSGIL